MLRGETIVCISPTSWFDIWRNRQQVMSKLAKHNRIIFVQPYDEKYTGSFIPPKIDILFTPWEFPFMSRFLPAFILRWTTPFMVKLNNFILYRYLKIKLSQLGIVEPILCIYDPLRVGILGHMNEKLSCWHVHDETSEFTFNRKISKTTHFNEECFSRNIRLLFEKLKLTTQELKVDRNNTQVYRRT